MKTLIWLAALLVSGLLAQEPPSEIYTIQTGTKIPLGLINSISTKHSAPGDRVYLETVFPIVVAGKIVIPPGSYVQGTVTEVKRPGRVKGRGELYVRFDSLTLPNGVTRDFRGRIGGLDGHSSESIDKAEGKVIGDSNKGGDFKTVAETTAAGASIGSIAGAASGHALGGIGIGSAAGMAAGLAGVLFTRGPDAVLTKGTTIEMVIDRPLTFAATELGPGGAPTAAVRYSTPDPATPVKSQTPGSKRIPF